MRMTSPLPAPSRTHTARTPPRGTASPTSTNKKEVRLRAVARRAADHAAELPEGGGGASLKRSPKPVGGVSPSEAAHRAVGDNAPFADEGGTSADGTPTSGAPDRESVTAADVPSPAATKEGSLVPAADGDFRTGATASATCAPRLASQEAVLRAHPWAAAVRLPPGWAAGWTAGGMSTARRPPQPLRGQGVCVHAGQLPAPPMHEQQRGSTGGRPRRRQQR